MKKKKDKNYLNLDIIHFCAKEVEYQHRGPIQVYWMLDAWNKAIELSLGLSKNGYSLEDIRLFGHLIEREVNPWHRWRMCEVRIGNDRGAPANELSERMIRWFSLQQDMSPEETYKEFELIHPFQDGNGRVGKIIYNWKNGTLNKPVFPFSFKEDKHHSVQA